MANDCIENTNKANTLTWFAFVQIVLRLDIIYGQLLYNDSGRQSQNESK